MLARVSVLLPSRVWRVSSVLVVRYVSKWKRPWANVYGEVVRNWAVMLNDDAAGGSGLLLCGNGKLAMSWS